jgi:flagellar brake protein
MEYESAFLIDNPEKIINKLFILLKNKCLITVYFGNEKDSFITTILDIYINNKYITFYHGPKEDSIKKLLDSKKITLKTEHLGAKVIFESIQIAKVQHQEVSIFVIPIPESMLWIETRNVHRIKFPISNSSRYYIMLDNEEKTKIQLYDISVSGFSIFTDSKEISTILLKDHHFEKCRIVFEYAFEDTISFCVQSKNKIKYSPLSKAEKIGCKFTKITPKFEDFIQKYLLNIEKIK